MGDGKQQQQQQQGELHAGAPLSHSSTNQAEAAPQEGASKDGSLTKHRPVGGSPPAPAPRHPASMDVNESPSPHIAINTYSTGGQEAAMGKSPHQHFKTPRRHKGIKVQHCKRA